MAELHRYAHEEQIDQSLEQQDSEQITDPKQRLDQVALTAQSTINEMKPEGLTTWFTDQGLDAEDLAEFRVLTFKAKEKKIVEDTRAKVMELMGKASENFVTEVEINNTSAAAQLEIFAWNAAQEGTRNAIESGREAGVTSLRVAQGHQQFLQEARTKTLQEWEQQKTTNQMALEQMSVWNDGLVALRAKARNEQFSKVLEDKMKAMFSELDCKAKQVEKNASTRVKNMAGYVQSVWDNTKSPDQKQALWAEILSVEASGGNPVNLNLAHFKLRAPQAKVDFVEALLQLEFVKKGLGINKESKAKHEQQGKDLESSRENMKKLEAFDFSQYTKLRESNGFKDLKPNLDNRVTHQQLLQILVNEVGGETVNQWISEAGSPDLMTDELRLAIVVNKLSSDQLKTPSVKQAFVDWYHQQELATNDGKAEYQQQSKVEAAYDQVGDKTKVLTDLLNGNLNLKLSDAAGKFTNFKQALLELNQDCIKTQGEFEAQAVEFAAADKAKIQEFWQKLLPVLNEALQLSDQWTQDKVAHAKWKQQKTQQEQKVKTTEGTLKTLTDKDDSRKQAAKKFETAQDALNQQQTLLQAKEESEPTLHSAVGLEQKLANLASLDNLIKNHRVVTPNTEGLAPMSERLKKKMLADYKAQVETEFLRRMGVNDQFKLLTTASEGSRVDITYQDCALAQNLSLPAELSDTPTNKSFKVLQAIPGMGVILQGLGSNEKLTILGSAVHSGRPAVNAKYSADGNNVRHANSIILNMQIH